MADRTQDLRVTRQIIKNIFGKFDETKDKGNSAKSHHISFEAALHFHEHTKLFENLTLSFAMY